MTGKDDKPAPLGKPRAPGTVVALGFVTFGIYWAYYYFKAFREVDKQAGKPHSALFFLAFIPLLSFLFGSIYVAVELRKMDAFRERIGLGPGMPWNVFMGWTWLGVWLFGIGPLVAMVKVADSINEVWQNIYARYGVEWPLEEPRQDGEDGEDGATRSVAGVKTSDEAQGWWTLRRLR